MRRTMIAAALFALAACGAPEPAPQSAPAQPAGPDPAVIQARIATLPAPYNEADYESGRRGVAQCRACHTFHAGGGHRQGPNLYGMFGRRAGAAENFSYSQALQQADFVWDGERLDHWLENPGTFLPGNRMAFAGVRDPNQRRDIIAYLMAATAE